jgi:hypothetical protein
VRRVADDEGIENPDAYPLTGTHFPDRTGLGSATNGYRPHLRPSIAHSCTSFSSGSAGTTTPMVILSLPIDTTGEVEKIGENEITPSEPPFPARR